MAAKEPKPLLVEARYAMKRNGRLTGTVCYRIRASTWSPDRPDDVYCTTLRDGQPVGCSCPHRQKSHKTCKHMEWTEQRERQRREQRMEVTPLNGNREFSLMRKAS
jgi:hypothetical protein